MLLNDIVETITEESYPKVYHNLLVEVGLIGSGKIMINGYYGGRKVETLDETSSTWKETNRFHTDYRDVPLFITPIPSPNGKVKGCWTQGLDKDTIKIINEECGIPIYKGEKFLRFIDGMVLDLSNPFHMVRFKILRWAREIAPSYEDMTTGVNYYFSMPEEKIKIRRQKISKRKQAIALSEKLNVADKRDILEYLVLEFDLNMAIESISNSDVHSNFEEYAYSNDKLKTREGYEIPAHVGILRAHEMPDRAHHVLANRAIKSHVLVADGYGGTISRPNGDLVASDFIGLVEVLKMDDNFAKEINQKVQGSKVRVTNTATTNQRKNINKLNPTIVKKYNTDIQRAADIAYWGIGPCMQYIAEKNASGAQIKHSLSELSPAEHWRKLVKNVFLGKHKVVFDNTTEAGAFPQIETEDLFLGEEEE